MTAVITEGGAAGRAPQAPDIPDLTLPEFVLGAAHQYGGKRALVDAATGRELSYAELADAVREVGAGMSARGIRPGDVLALCTPNCLEFAVAWFAATSAGAIVTTDADGRGGQGPDHQRHQLRRRLPMAAGVRLRGLQGRAGEADRDPGRRDAPAWVSIFSVDPGLLRVGLGEAALNSTADRQTPAGRVHGWIADQFDAGRGADPERAARLILALADGRADRLSGRHLCVGENLEALLGRIDEIERDDLHTLRLRTGI